MEQHPPRSLDVLGQLAVEYQQKFKEVSELCRNTDPNWVYAQLEGRGELTTERFRMAQQVLLQHIASESGDQGGTPARQATFTLCRCFDEMRILFQNLMDYCAAQIAWNTNTTVDSHSS